MVSNEGLLPLTSLYPLQTTFRKALASRPLKQWQYLNVDIIKRVLNGAAQMDAKGQTLSIGRILSVITKNSQTRERRELVFRHVLWLLKYGFIELLNRGTRMSKELAD